MHFTALTLASLLSSAFAAPLGAIRDRAEGWSIRGFTRNCTDPNICTYKFSIDLNDGSPPIACTTVDTADPATTHAWYDVPCQETADYHISWGWDYRNDFTVMTVVDEPLLIEAFFGYANPNKGNPVSTYKDVGPNAVQADGA